MKRTVYDDINEISETIDDEEAEEKPNKVKKILFSVAGVLVVLLVISLSLPLARIGSIVESEKIDENFIIILKDGTLIEFSEIIFNELSTRFATNKDEFKVCLKGEKLGSTYLINNFYNPEILGSSFMHVTSLGCDSSTLISMHSHPSMFCIFSSQDLKSYESLQRRNSKAMIGLMCGPDRFNFYGY